MNPRPPYRLALCALILPLLLIAGPPLAHAQRTLSPSITTQGNTGSASTVTVLVKNGSQLISGADFIRVRVCNDDGYATATNATIAPASGTTTAETLTSNKDLVLKSSVATQATGTLTVSGTVGDAETVTVGSRVYEFDSHSTSTITAGRVRVNISGNTTAAQGTLTLAVQPTAGDTMTIGTRTYSYVASGTADEPGEISRGADLAAAKTATIAAINGTDAVNTANATVSAGTFSGDDLVLTARAGGTAGNSIVTTETFASGSNIFDAATLGTTTAGTNCSAANAVTALVTAIDGDASAVVDAADGAGDTVVITADSAGSAGNSLASTETMTNGAFGAATLASGADQRNGRFVFTVTNATAETVTVRFGAPPLGGSSTNWTTTLDVTHAAP